MQKWWWWLWLYTEAICCKTSKISWNPFYESLCMSSWIWIPAKLIASNFFLYYSYAATQNTINDDYYNCQPNKYGHSFYTIQWGNQFCLILLQSGWFTLRKFQCQTISLNKSRSLIKFDVQMYGNATSMWNWLQYLLLSIFDFIFFHLS